MSILFASFWITTSSFADESIEKLESCYGTPLITQQTQEGDTKTTEVLSEDQMAARCNHKVLDEAAKAKDVDKVLALAGVIGRKSNWPSSAPAYAIAAKIDQKKTCNDENAILSIKMGLAHPADYAPVKGVKLLMEACWPEDKGMLTHLVVDASDSYTKLSLCPFLQVHQAKLTKMGESVCKESNE